MLIAVISDSHMGRPPAWLDTVYDKWLAPADHLVHCGDITSPATWSYFLRHPSFHCVRGNCDHDRQLVDELEPMLTTGLGPLTVGVTHGWGPRSQVSLAVARAFGPEYDLVCYGHTHIPDWSIIENVQVCNPGSLGEGSLAQITVSENGALNCEFIRF
ncbi:metallophosphoesterase family protein [Pseudodesulfovibrio sp.]|uniref:metallophosphoesterase family protein n=1 Tax=unclassified Pseudodesulfovibrio TaxID=2661612 RepID=UPI003B001D57